MSRSHGAAISFRIEGASENAQAAIAVLDFFLIAHAGRNARSRSRIFSSILWNSAASAVFRVLLPTIRRCPQLHTRRADLRGRTPRQRDYIEQFSRTTSRSVSDRRARARPISRSPLPSMHSERDVVKRIVLTRPAVEAGERLGFLPGDLAQKVDPYCDRFTTRCSICWGSTRRSDCSSGRRSKSRRSRTCAATLNQSFVILDEAQNTTREQMKMFLTRIGFGSKAVVTGDVTQMDLPRGIASGLIEAQHVLAEVRGIAFTYFTAADVVRHPLVGRIVEAYEAAEARSQASDPARAVPALVADTARRRAASQAVWACRAGALSSGASPIRRTPRAYNLEALDHRCTGSRCATDTALRWNERRSTPEPRLPQQGLPDGCADLQLCEQTRCTPMSCFACRNPARSPCRRKPMYDHLAHLIVHAVCTLRHITTTTPSPHGALPHTRQILKSLGSAPY